MYRWMTHLCSLSPIQRLAAPHDYTRPAVPLHTHMLLHHGSHIFHCLDFFFLKEITASIGSQLFWPFLLAFLHVQRDHTPQISIRCRTNNPHIHQVPSGRVQVSRCGLGTFFCLLYLSPPTKISYYRHDTPSVSNYLSSLTFLITWTIYLIQRFIVNI